MENNKDYIFANIKDKINLTNKRNKIQNTVFYTEQEQTLIERELKKIKAQNYFFFGGFEDAERKCIIFYPEKFSKDIVISNLNDIISVIKVVLPNELMRRI